MSTQDAVLRFRSLGRGTTGGIVLTALIHGALIALVVIGNRAKPAGAETEHDVIVTEIATFGKPREKFWLPRIVQPPKPKAPPDVVKVSENLNAPPAPKEAPKPEDHEVSKDLKKALERARKLQAAAEEEPEEGLLTGSREGTSSQATEGDACATAVYTAIRKNWSVPAGLLTADISKLEAVLRVKIADDGGLAEPRVVKGSGNVLFDSSCIEAVTATRTVPDLGPQCRTRFKRGVALQFDGASLR